MTADLFERVFRALYFAYKRRFSSIPLRVSSNAPDCAFIYHTIGQANAVAFWPEVPRQFYASRLGFESMINEIKDYFKRIKKEDPNPVVDHHTASYP